MRKARRGAFAELNDAREISQCLMFLALFTSAKSPRRKKRADPLFQKGLLRNLPDALCASTLFFKEGCCEISPTRFARRPPFSKGVVAKSPRRALRADPLFQRGLLRNLPDALCAPTPFFKGGCCEISPTRFARRPPFSKGVVAKSPRRA